MERAGGIEYSEKDDD